MGRRNLLVSISITFIILCLSFRSYSQINLLDAQFFQNRYLANPAMAGLEGGTRVNLGYRNQWGSIAGAPVDQNFTLENRTNRVGTGLSVINAKAGDLSHTKIYGSYSYALPLNNQSSKFHFGLNFGFQRTSFNAQNIKGDPNDRNITTFNDRQSIIDGDLGLGYSSERFSIDGAFYNLKNQLFGDGSDLDLGSDFNLYYFGAAYAIPMPEYKINTKLAYRNIKNFKDIVDAGAEIRTSNDELGFTGIYHTNKSSTFGISYLHNKEWQLIAMYNTSASPIANYTNGAFEIALQLYLHNMVKN